MSTVLRLVWFNCRKSQSRSTQDKEIGASGITGAHYVISKSPALKPVSRRQLAPASSPSPLLKHRRFQRYKSSSLRERKRSLEHPAAAYSDWKQQQRRSSLGCLEIGVSCVAQHYVIIYRIFAASVASAAGCTYHVLLPVSNRQFETMVTCVHGVRVLEKKTLSRSLRFGKFCN